MKSKIASTSEVVKFINLIPSDGGRIKQAELMCKKSVWSRKKEPFDDCDTVIQLFGLKTLKQIAVISLKDAGIKARTSGALGKDEIKKALLPMKLVSRLLILQHKGEYAASLPKKGWMIWRPIRDVQPILEIKVKVC